MSAHEMVAPKFLGSVKNIELSSKQKKLIKKRVENASVNKSIESLLVKLNTITKYEDIPDKITFSYEDLISRELDFKDTYDLVNLTANLAAARFGEKQKHIQLTGFSGKAIDDHNCSKLAAAGFVGCGLTPAVHGFEATDDDKDLRSRDPSYWNPLINGNAMIITRASPLDIALTYRQQQILDLICKKGLTNYQIAKQLGLSDSTVKMHIGIVLKKYAVQSRSHLILAVQESKEIGKPTKTKV